MEQALQCGSIVKGRGNYCSNIRLVCSGGSQIIICDSETFSISFIEDKKTGIGGDGGTVNLVDGIRFEPMTSTMST